MNRPDAPDSVQEQLRLQALAELGLMDTPPEAEFDALTRLAARCLDMPMALISLVGRDRQWFKSHHGTDETGYPRSGAFCDQVVRNAATLQVPDARDDPRFAAHPMVKGEPHLRFYAGHPLTTEDGHVLGSFCVLDVQPRQLDSAQHALLADLAAQAQALLLARRQTLALQDALRTLQRERDRLSRLEQSLQAEQQLNREVIEHAPVGIALYDTDGQCLAANPAIARHVGGSVAELLKQNIFRIRPMADSGLLEPVRLALHDGRHGSGVLKWRTSFGHDAWLALDFVPMGQQTPRQLMVISSDLSQLQEAEEQRRDSEASYRTLFMNSLDGVLQTRPSGEVIAANPAACQQFGLSEAEICRRGRGELLDLGDPRLAVLLTQRQREGRALGVIRMLRAGGQPFEAEVSSVIFNDAQGLPVASVMFRDITQRLQTEQQLQDSLKLLDNLAQRVPGAIFQYLLRPDGSTCFPFASEGIQAIYELSPDALKLDAGGARARIHPEDLEGVLASIAASADTLQLWTHEFRVRLPLQGERWRLGSAQPERLPDGGVLWHGFITDITDRKQADAQTHWLAYYDPLTGLPNRRLLLDHMGQALSGARRSGQTGAVLFIDLDHFKHVNDAMGHSVGDALLQRVARALKQVTREIDTVARLGGDEFVVLLTQLGPSAELGAQHAMSAADKLRRALQSQHEIAGRSYNVSCSIGVSLFPQPGQSVDDLLREADTAMYRAKAGGRDRIAFFETTMYAEVQDRLNLEHDLQEALHLGQLSVHVQPQLSGQGEVQGAELLLRWQHPDRGAVSPAQFIPVAEESGLILAMGELVLRQACQALARLRQAGRLVPLSVNVSPRQFRQEDFIDRLDAVLAETGAPADALILEVTENLLIEDWQGTLQRMERLVARGIRFSIDDFGTGYSSLAYLRRLPLYELKIDRSFVQDIPGDPDATAIVQAMLSMARLLKLRVVAEGVETPQQSAYLVDHGCDCQQGYFHARPQALEAWLQRHLGLAG